MRDNDDIVVIDEEGNVVESNAVPETVNKERAKQPTAIRDNLGEFARSHDDADVVYIDEEGNVVEANRVESTSRQKGPVTAIRDNLGEFSNQTEEEPEEDPEVVIIDEEGNVVEYKTENDDNKENNEIGEHKTTVVAIRDNLGEFARVHLGASRDLLILGSDLNRPRWRIEFEKVSAYCKGFRFKSRTRRGEKVIDSVEGTFTIAGRRYGLRVKIPENYPYVMPSVYPMGWDPSGAPHRYGGGALCLMQPSQWSEVYSIALVIKKAQYWVHKYNHWNRTGRWPGKSQD